MNPLTTYSPDAYQFTKAIHGHVEKLRAVTYRWNKVAKGQHEEFDPVDLTNIIEHAAAAGGYDVIWDRSWELSRTGRLMTYLAGKSW